MKDEIIKAKRALIQFYLTVKIRKEDEADDITKEKLAEEEERIEHLSLMSLVNYIKSSIDVIIAIKIDEAMSKSKNPLIEDNTNAARNYETLLRKEENEIRQHISIENQLKIHIEKITEEIEELAKENAILKKKVKNAKKENQFIIEEKIMQSQTNEIENLKKTLQSYEDKELKYDMRERKYKMQLIEKDKEIKRLESKLLARKSSSFVLVEKERDKEALSSCSSICSISRTNRKSTDEKKNKNRTHDITPMQIQKTQIIEQLEKYRKLIDKKVSDVTRNKTYILRDRSCANGSYNPKEKMENEMSLIMPKTDLTQRSASQKKLNENETLGANNTNVNANIIMKKVPIPNSNNRNYTSNKMELHVKKKQPMMSIGRNNNKMISHNSIPILINRAEVSCNNNINIIGGNGTYHIQQKDDCQQKNTNQLNLRQYIFTKYGTANLINQIK